MHRFISFLFLSVFSFCSFFASAQVFDQPIVGEEVVFEEVGGLLTVEAEHFYKQTATDVRRWYRTSADERPVLGRDPDEAHVDGASNNAYLEILPDTRTNHGDKLIVGENFINEAGKMAILYYKVHINNPGRYYVWVRTYSTNSEDNGVHVGIDGTWPEHGQRMQWTAKNQWFWDCKQRTAEVHTGVLMEIYLDIEKAGEHEIIFSMREDGFEFDKFMLVKDKAYRPEQNEGPAVRVKRGELPPPFIKIGERERQERAVEANGEGRISIDGELKQWHKVTLTMDGPFAHEQDNEPNPFQDYRMTVTFTHESGSPKYEVPGYFAADGNAGESSAESGVKWRAHLSPDKIGKWNYSVSFIRGEMAAIADDLPWTKVLSPYDGKTGSFQINASDKSGLDLRAKGRLEYVGGHYLQFQGSGEYFLKAGADAPETLLGYEDFDGTEAFKKNVPLKKYASHVKDWKNGDLTWQGGKGKGLVGAVNYLASKGVNVFSFLTYNAGGDGENVWPFTSRSDKYHYDCSKLDQWQMVFDYAQSLGMYLHFKTQEQENDDNTKGQNNTQVILESLDGGDLGPQRRIYYRELIARYGHLLALNWNLGEENTQSTAQQQAAFTYIAALSPYKHNIVLHTFPNQQDNVYTPLLGDENLTGLSLQNEWDHVHKRTLQWVKASEEAGKPLVIANDEQGNASEGVPPDPGYPGFESDKLGYDLHDIRKQVLWGNLMAGGAGVEYYFGYRLPQNDLICEDFRSRDQSWDYCRIALEFFQQNDIPFWEMKNRNELVGNDNDSKEKYCFAKEGEIYLVYMAYTESTTLNLSKETGNFSVSWFNPRTGEWHTGKVKKAKGGKVLNLKQTPGRDGKDWVVVVRKEG